MGSIVIHASSAVPWQVPFAEKMRSGLSQIGLNARLSSNRTRESDIAILCGTTLWRGIEESGRFLLIDRCSFGDTNQWVSLVWDGHGRRGNHCVPDELGDRWKQVGVELKRWTFTGTRRVLCGQTETYSPHFRTLVEWYSEIRNATHFRKHPAGDNPTGLPAAKDWTDVAQVITLNSSIGVDAILNGLPTVAMDEGSMAWDAASHFQHIRGVCDREPWVRWLAWTQWHHEEIAAGHPIKHLFEVM